MIQIHQPEVEALIQHRLTAGGFDNIEDVLLQALQDAPLPGAQCLDFETWVFETAMSPRIGRDLNLAKSVT